jgi:arsenical pump membrane protein
MLGSIAAAWGIAAAATGGVIVRPWKLPEAVWAVAGAALLVATGLLAPADAARGVEKGNDVYLFLIGMMLLAELARQEGLFVLVEALNKTGLIAMLAEMLQAAARHCETQAAVGAGVLLAVAGNLMNNLPAGLIAGTVVQAAHPSPQVTGAVLIGVDLGPNLSVTGSLATILWLSALRREGHHVGAWHFLKLGVFVMPPALVVALGGLMASRFIAAF